MRILVTGGLGYIGSHVAMALIESGYDVILLDNLINTQENVLEVLKRLVKQKGIPLERLTFFPADIRDREALRNVFLAAKPEAVVHLAGLKAVGESVARPLDYYENNVTGSIILLQTMREHEVFTIVFSSSATVYGEASEPPFSETAPTAPTNPYGRTKLMIEEILSDLANSDERFRIVSLRYFNPVGAHESGWIGEMPQGVPNNLMPYVMQVAAGLRETLYVFGNDYPTPDGTGVRDYIHVLDLARGHVLALDYALRHGGYEVFNLGRGKGASVLEVIRTFEEVNGISVPYTIAARRPGDVAVSFAATDKAERLLGFQAAYDLKDMCRHAWQFQKRLLSAQSKI
ncbi:MAG: UDP-glucose 4-epimerase GalE [Candidatus Carbobacillus sp.]|nr:UDP-glucose 4-epimerase GalE [Candidatus Carbobacillus sp.]